MLWSQEASWAQALTLGVFLFIARATLEILIPDFVKQTSEEKPKDSEELEVSVLNPAVSRAVASIQCLCHPHPTSQVSAGYGFNHPSSR